MVKRRNFLDTGATVVRSWYMVCLAGLGALAVIAGVFEPGFERPWLSLALGAAIVSAGLLDIVRRLQGHRFVKFPDPLEGPLLWTVTAWIFLRVATPYMVWFAPLIPACFIAWLVVTYPPQIFLFPSLIALAMEGGVTAAGYHQPAIFRQNLVLYAAVTAALYLFVRSETYRGRMRAGHVRARKEEDSREYARDLGLVGQNASLLETLHQADDLGDPGWPSRPTVEKVTSSFNLQLEIIRQALSLTTVAVLWANSNGRELRLRSMATTRKDILPGPYPMGRGITGALLRERETIAVAPVKPSFAGLPYYRDQGGVGSLLAMKIPVDDGPDSVTSGGKVSGILCVDRVSESEWKDDERKVLQLATRKLSIDVSMGRRLLTLDRERSAFQRVCIGLRELNSSLELEQVFDAAIKAVSLLVQADFTAISLLQDEEHRVVRAEGKQADKFLGMENPRDEGLVGQVLKMNSALPVGARYKGPAPVFNNARRLPEFGSLLILPLRDEEGAPMGALTVAVGKPGAFNQSRREILELIAAQVAIKIDLGQAHEQINKMATIDGLTELANHRTFQHGLDIMLERAQRRGSPLCLILCDLDYFKKVNDNHGHPFGDKVLRTVAGVLRDAVRKVDLAARYGGEEFAIILEDSNELGGRLLAERVREEIESLNLQHKGKEVQVTLSLGIAAFPVDGKLKSDLISRADQALYQAKNSGRNRTVAWSEITGDSGSKA